MLQPNATADGQALALARAQRAEARARGYDTDAPYWREHRRRTRRLRRRVRRTWGAPPSHAPPTAPRGREAVGRAPGPRRAPDRRATTPANLSRPP